MLRELLSMTINKIYHLRLSRIVICASSSKRMSGQKSGLTHTSRLDSRYEWIYLRSLVIQIKNTCSNLEKKNSCFRSKVGTQIQNNNVFGAGCFYSSRIMMEYCAEVDGN